MGITHKPMYHMWTTDDITLLMITHNTMYICTGQQTVYYPSNGDYT